MTDQKIFNSFTPEEVTSVTSLKKLVKGIVQKMNKSQHPELHGTVLFPACILAAIFQEKGSAPENDIYFHAESNCVFVKVPPKGAYRALDFEQYFYKLYNGNNWGNGIWASMRINNQPSHIAKNVVANMIYHKVKDNCMFKRALYAVRIALDIQHWENAWTYDEVPVFGFQSVEEMIQSADAKAGAGNADTSRKRVRPAEEEPQGRQKRTAQVRMEYLGQADAAKTSQRHVSIDSFYRKNLEEAQQLAALADEMAEKSELDESEPEVMPKGKDRSSQSISTRARGKKLLDDDEGESSESGSDGNVPSKNRGSRRSNRRVKDSRRAAKRKASDAEPDSGNEPTPPASSAHSSSSDELEEEVEPAAEVGAAIAQDGEDDAKDIEEILREMCGDTSRSREHVELELMREFHDKYMKSDNDLIERFKKSPAKKMEVGAAKTEVDEETLRFISQCETAKHGREDSIMPFLQKTFRGSADITLRPSQVERCVSMYRLLKYGPSSRFFILSEEMGGGKTFMSIALCLLFMSDEVQDDMHRDFCVVLCPKNLVQQWADAIRTMSAEAIVFTPDTNDQYVSREYYRCSKAAAAGRPTFAVMSHTVLGNTQGKNGNNPCSNLASFIRRPGLRRDGEPLQCYAVLDESHQYCRNSENASSTNLSAMFTQYGESYDRYYSNPVMQLTTGTPVMTAPEAWKILNLLAPVHLPLQVRTSNKAKGAGRDISCKVLQALSVPGTYDSQKVSGDPVRCAQYRLIVPTSQFFSGERSAAQARLCRVGFGDDPFELPISLYVILLASWLWQTFEESCVVFWENVPGLTTLRDYISKTERMKEYCFFFFGDMTERDRQRQVTAWQDKGGIIFSTLAMMRDGSNMCLDVNRKSADPKKKCVRFGFVIGASSNWRVEQKMQLMARLDRFGQVHPAVIIFYTISKDEYSKGVQEIVDQKQKGKGASDNTRMEESEALAERDRRADAERARQRANPGAGKKKVQEVKVKEVELKDLPALALGLLHLAEHKLILNVRDYGFEPDADSRIQPASLTAKVEIDSVCNKIRNAVYTRIKSLKSAGMCNTTLESAGLSGQTSAMERSVVQEEVRPVALAQEVRGAPESTISDTVTSTEEVRVAVEPVMYANKVLFPQKPVRMENTMPPQVHPHVTAPETDKVDPHPLVPEPKTASAAEEVSVETDKVDPPLPVPDPKTASAAEEVSVETDKVDPQPLVPEPKTASAAEGEPPLSQPLESGSQDMELSGASQVVVEDQDKQNELSGRPDSPIARMESHDMELGGESQVVVEDEDKQNELSRRPDSPIARMESQDMELGGESQVADGDDDERNEKSLQSECSQPSITPWQEMDLYDQSQEIGGQEQEDPHPVDADPDTTADMAVEAEGVSLKKVECSDEEASKAANSQTAEEDLKKNSVEGTGGLETQDMYPEGYNAPAASLLEFNQEEQGQTQLLSASIPEDVHVDPRPAETPAAADEVSGSIALSQGVQEDPEATIWPVDADKDSQSASLSQEGQGGIDTSDEKESNPPDQEESDLPDEDVQREDDDHSEGEDDGEQSTGSMESDSYAGFNALHNVLENSIPLISQASIGGTSNSLPDAEDAPQEASTACTLGLSGYDSDPDDSVPKQSQGCPDDKALEEVLLTPQKPADTDGDAQADTSVPIQSQGAAAGTEDEDLKILSLLHNVDEMKNKSS